MKKDYNKKMLPKAVRQAWWFVEKDMILLNTENVF